MAKHNEPRTGPVRLRAQITGLGGARKSWLATHLPTEGPTWDGKIVYIDADPTSQTQESTAPSDRSRLIPVTPDGNAETIDGHLVTDWLGEFNELTQTHWKSRYPEACALVWDSGTESTRKLLVENMRMNYFHDKKPSTGHKNDKDPRFRLTKEERTAIGDKGDYRMVHEGFLEGLSWLIRLNPDIHIIFTFHECLGDGEQGKRRVIGPSIQGKVGPRKVPHFFGANLYTSVSNGQDGGKEGQTRILLDSREDYIANIKANKPHPPVKFLDFDPDEARNFWLYLQDLKT